MMGNGASGMEIEQTISFFYDSVKTKNLNHFQVLGIPTNATHRDIESAYKKYAAEFSEQKLSAITNPEVLQKAEYLVQLGKRAYDVLIDYKKRGEYEKKGYREVDPDAEKEDDPEETAKAIYKKAKSLHVMKNYRLAVKGLKEAVILDPKKSEYFLLLGLCQSQLPDLKRDAEINLQKASEMEAWNAEPIVALGMLFQSERLNKRAEGYYRKALEIQNDHQVARKKLAEVAAPDRKPLDKVGDSLQKGLGKYLPSLFGKKKK
jgi:tetratricopeptide (TPR) repeat protein